MKYCRDNAEHVGATGTMLYRRSEDRRDLLQPTNGAKKTLATLTRRQKLKFSTLCMIRSPCDVSEDPGRAWHGVLSGLIPFSGAEVRLSSAWKPRRRGPYQAVANHREAAEDEDAGRPLEPAGDRSAGFHKEHLSSRLRTRKTTASEVERLPESDT